MDPALVQALSILIGTVSTVILMAANFYFGPRRRQDRDDNDRPDSDNKEE